jgi:3-methyl-2-oxobutanoate hydroxymethyltransferase
MSANKLIEKMTVPIIKQMKNSGQKIAVLTAYDFLMAEMEDAAGIDIILVGDSAGMVLAGFESTLPVTMEMMLYHVASVKRGVKRALVVADMPFLSYQTSVSDAVSNAGKFLKQAGAEAVKLEGGSEYAATIERMVAAGIPVMGHLGLTPQSINSFGSYQLVGNDEDSVKQMIADAKTLENAGVFSIVLEKIPSTLAEEITKSISVPTIGIGAGPACNGQVLVAHDMLGIFDKFKPRFVRRYAELADIMRKSIANYVHDVKSSNFPAKDESY